jgi:hypothetical protein
MGLDERFEPKISRVNHLDDSPILLRNILIISKLSQIRPMVDCKEESVAITMKDHR